jgi:hypothetical protein
MRRVLCRGCRLFILRMLRLDLSLLSKLAVVMGSHLFGVGKIANDRQES